MDANAKAGDMYAIVNKNGKLVDHPETGAPTIFGQLFELDEVAAKLPGSIDDYQVAVLSVVTVIDI